MRIGITIMSRPEQNVWNNGLLQNIYHLASLLGNIPFVESIYILNCGDGLNHPGGTGPSERSLPLVHSRDVLDELDVAIEMGGVLDGEWIRLFRARGGHVVYHGVGQPYAALVEATLFGRDSSIVEPERYDEIWLLPKDRPYAPMMRSYHRCPVHEVAYVWAPTFLERTIAECSDPSLFGYQAGSISTQSVRVAIFEPNISPIKMGLIPMLIAEEAERRYSGLIAHVDFLNGVAMATHPSFVFFMRNTSLYASERVSIQGRNYFTHTMARGANLVISHQIDCPQNYLYLDALYGGYPLIHNSRLLKDVGYFYEDGDIEGGVTALMRAVEAHDREFEAYQRIAHQFVAGHAPSARHNIESYGRRLVSLDCTANGRIRR